MDHSVPENRQGFEHIRDRYFYTMAKEAYLKKKKQEAEKQCTAEVEEFAQCMKGRTVSALWVCREFSDRMNACVKYHQYLLVQEDMERGAGSAQSASADPPSEQPQE